MKGLPPGWEEVRLGDVCAVFGGSTPRTGVPEYWNGDIPWITPDDLSRHSGKFIERGARSITQVGFASSSTRMVLAGTVLFSSRAPIGYVAIASQPVCTNQGFKSVVPPEGILSDYLYWYLRHVTPTIQGMASGTTFKEISKKRMLDVPLRIPPTGEQERIVAAIEEHFSRLDAAEANLATANSRVVALRRSFLAIAQSSEWPEHSLGDLLDGIEAGKSFKTPGHPADADGWGVIKVSAMTWGEFDESENKAIPDPSKIDARFEIRPGDLLLSRANTSEYVGATVLVGHCRPRLLLSDKSMRLRVVDGVCKPWLLFALLSPQLRSQMSAVATGTSDSMRNISQAKVRALRIRVPPTPVQIEVAARIQAGLDVSARLGGEITAARQRSASLRLQIMRAAFRGDLVEQSPDDEPATRLLQRIAALHSDASNVAERAAS